MTAQDMELSSHYCAIRTVLEVGEKPIETFIAKPNSWSDCSINEFDLPNLLGQAYNIVPVVSHRSA